MEGGPGSPNAPSTKGGGFKSAEKAKGHLFPLMEAGPPSASGGSGLAMLCPVLTPWFTSQTPWFAAQGRGDLVGFAES